jgi:hypothetical protein
VPLSEKDIFEPGTRNTFEVILYEKRVLKDKVWKFNPRFVVVPDRIAVVKTHLKLIDKVREESPTQSGTVGVSSAGRGGKHNQNVFRAVNPGWQIDRASIKVTKIKGNGSAHEVSGPYEITPVSFSAKAYAKKGKAVGQVTWTEFRMVDKPTTQILQNEVGFGTSQVIALPEGASLLKTEVEFFDGSTKFETAKSYFKTNYVEFHCKEAQGVIELRFQ